MQSPPSRPTRIAIIERFRMLYIVLALLFVSLTVGGLAWQWNQPKNYANGFPYRWSVPILLIASVLVNGISFYFQDRHFRRMLQHQDLETFRPIIFALRFYLYNLATAIVLSIVCFYPMLILFFFYWIYPIVSWLLPYHVLMGVILGWDIQRSWRSSLR